tara:strand:- start:898 stop:1293 length:396 start_codon:yes stop_codon:yes gene_type:complete
MAKAKLNKKESTKIKAKDVPEKEVEVAPKKEAQSYLVPLAFQREPVDKNIPVADIFYHKFSNSFELQCSAPQHEAHVEMIVEGDISIEESGNIRMVSKTESPVSWIINLNKSREFSGNPFIAGEAQEIYEA